jgi:hypothetical protein
MTPTTFDRASPYALDAGGTSGPLRNTLFLATFLLIWLTAAPFPDLADPRLLEPVGDGNFLGQALAALLTIALVAFLLPKDAGIVLKALTPILVVTFLWFAFSAVLSAHPALATRRLLLAALTIFQAAAFVLLPQDRDHFARLLLLGALTVLAITAPTLWSPSSPVRGEASSPTRTAPERAWWCSSSSASLSPAR